MTKRTGPTETYLVRAKALAEAIDLATKVRRGALDPVADAAMTKFEQETKTMALNPEPAFARVASLKYLETAFFTYWNESPEPYVKTFWREIAKRGLPFHRRDAANDALERGRITCRVDYETVTDALGDERFTDTEKKKLDALLGSYEKVAAKKRRRRQ